MAVAEYGYVERLDHWKVYKFVSRVQPRKWEGSNELHPPSLWRNWMFKALHVAVVASLLMLAGPVVAASKAPSNATQSAPVDLNTATLAQLNALPGIGATRAAAIIAARPYASINDLLTKHVVTQAIFDKIKASITVSGGRAVTSTANSAKTVAKAPPPPPAATPDATPPEPSSLIDLNTATTAELEALPGIGPAKSGAIVAARPFRSTNDLVTKGIVSASTFAKIKSMIEVGAPVASTTTPTTAGKLTSTGKQAEIARIRACGAQWRADKAAGRIPAGQTWPKYWSACSARLKAQGQ